MRRSGPAGRAADLLLSALIIAAPLAAGSWKLEVLPALLTLTVAAWGATYAALHGRRRDLHVGLLPIALFIFGVLTVLQAVPLPAGLLGWLSPEAQSLRAFVQGDAGGGPLSYEPGATLREASKLFMYALVAQVALERARGRGLRERVAIPLVIAGLTATGVAVLHRALGIERLFGLLDTVTTGRHMLTTFVNPNHAAAFTALVTVTAVGLAVRARDGRRKLAFGGAGLVSAGLCLSTGSKGGVLALVLGLVAFGILFALRDRRADRRLLRPGIAAVAAAITLIPALLFTWYLDRLAAWLEPNPDGAGLGLTEKAAAMQDALPMALAHRWFGVGRGAYVSVYTRYKTSDLQLTFAFPENVVAQLVSEWGLVIGIAALIGIGAAVLARLWRVQNTVGLAMTCGVAAVLGQNLVDFGLELPGLALPAVAVLGGVSGDWPSRVRLRTKASATWVVAAVVPLAGALACAFAFVQGDLPKDLATIEADIERARTKAPAMSADELERRVVRHPASALIAAQAAYLAEISDPPRLEEAVRWANRALYLAPTYAGGHLVTGRLLIRAGHRTQGFGELRRAWSLSGADRKALYVRHVIELARSPEEVARALPRRDPALDVIQERALALAVRRLAASGRQDWARRLLEDHVDVAEVPDEDVWAVTIAADAAGQTDLALALAERLLTARPDDHRTRLLAARIAFRHGRPERARQLLAGLEPTGPEAESLLELRLRLEIEAKDREAALESLRALRAIATPGLKRETTIVLLEVQLHRAVGAPDEAREALDRAIAAHPGAAQLRMRRAKLLLELQRPAAAASDLEHVLGRRPEDAEARRLLDQARRAMARPE